MKYNFDKKEHLHLLDDKPLTGTSSVGDVLSKNLVWWAAELAAVECLEAGEKIPTIREEYLTAAASKDKKRAIDELQLKYPIFKKARFAHFAKKKEAAKTGVNLHSELEHFVKAKMGINPMRADYDAKIKPFIDWAEKEVKTFLWSEAHCFDEELWVGGISDTGVELNNGNIAVIDFKSSQKAYPNHFIQAGGYAIQIDKNGLWDCEGKMNKKLDKPISSLIIVPFGAEQIEPVIKYDVEGYKNGFKSAVVLYRLLNN